MASFRFIQNHDGKIEHLLTCGTLITSERVLTKAFGPPNRGDLWILLDQRDGSSVIIHPNELDGESWNVEAKMFKLDVALMYALVSQIRLCVPNEMVFSSVASQTASLTSLTREGILDTMKMDSLYAKKVNARVRLR